MKVSNEYLYRGYEDTDRLQEPRKCPRKAKRASSMVKVSRMPASAGKIQNLSSKNLQTLLLKDTRHSAQMGTLEPSLV